MLHRYASITYRFADCDRVSICLSRCTTIVWCRRWAIETHDPVEFAAGLIELMNSPRVNQVI